MMEEDLDYKQQTYMQGKAGVKISTNNQNLWHQLPDYFLGSSAPNLITAINHNSPVDKYQNLFIASYYSQHQNFYLV